MTLALRRALPVLLLAVFACDTTAPPPQQQAPPPVRAQAQPPYAPAAPAPAPYTDPEIQQTVARISVLDGNVYFWRGDDPENWQPADLNIPMTLGDRVWTGEDGRVELQVHGGSVVRLAARTDAQALNLTSPMKQFSISLGTASFQVRRLADDEVFEVDTPNAAVTFERPGDYRVDVDNEGNSRVQVRRGRAIASAGGGQVPLSAGDEVDIDGIDQPRYEVVAVPRPDRWDQWVGERDQQLAQSTSYTYVTADIAGVEDLDRYGRWEQIPDYGWTWSPVSVDVGWAPYRAGRWIWQDPWGWTWVAAEPWGWAPYHYGRWVFYGARWCWVPVGPPVRSVAYSPALVAFVGGSGGYVGWFPLAPRDPFYPWWRRGPTVNVTNVTYVNRTYITVVNQTVFVSGRNVSRDFVRDRTVIRTVEATPVLRGPVPVVPTRESIRMTSRPSSAVGSPAAPATRGVVVRVPPPAAQPRFDAKVAVIKQNQGAPITTSEAARMSAQDRTQPAVRVRPVAPESGGVTLVPRNDATRSSRPAPVASPSSAPAAPSPVAIPTQRARQSERPPERVTPPPTERPAEASRPPARVSARPTPRHEPQSEVTPQRAGSERAVAPPPMRERAQPAESVAPAPKPAERQRPTPKPTPTKKPKD
jgi:FecR protein